jgi:hypothetical protein
LDDGSIGTGAVEIEGRENVDDIMQVIEKKCNRAYPGRYALVVHARHRGKVLELDQVRERMKSLPSPFLAVWVVAWIGTEHVKAALANLKLRAALRTYSIRDSLTGLFKPLLHE